jgi:hypothetical protein
MKRSGHRQQAFGQAFGIGTSTFSDGLGTLASAARRVVAPACCLEFRTQSNQTLPMNKGGHGLAWAFIHFIHCTLVFCCPAAPSIDPFLTLGAPSVVSNQVEFTLTGEADVSYVIESSPDAQSWQPVTTNISAEVTRQITVEAPTNDLTFYRAWREPLPRFFGAFVVRSNINLNGNNIIVDSYDSGDPNHADSWGRYDPVKRKAGGDVFSASGFIDAGNADIKGKLYTGATNAGQYFLGLDGSVGDLIWMGPGIQPGWNHTNFHWALPDVVPPYLTGLPPMSVPGTTNFWELGNAEYMFNGNINANSSSSISVIGDASVAVTGSFNFSGTIDIAPGASLKLYVGGLQTRLNQVNTTGQPTNFQYYGLPTNKTIAWGGNDEYVATIYAPQAVVKLGGGGNNIYDFSGACVAESITINGHFNVHFDENLKRIGPRR